MYYHIPLPPSDYYTGLPLDASSGLNSKDWQPPPSDTLLKWYNSDEDSYGSVYPKAKKFSCKRLPTIQSGSKFLNRVTNDPQKLPFWAMIEILVDLKFESNILNQAWTATNQRRKANQGQHCFIKCDQTCCNNLDLLLHKWHWLAHEEENKWLVPLRVK